MESAFSWIGEIIEWFGKFIPHLVIVRATHAGVKFVRGANVKELKPGIHFYWPIVTEVEIMPVSRQTKNLVTQVLTTKDKRAVAMGVVVVYQIDDIVKVLVDNYDINDTIYDITQVAVVQSIAGHNYDEVLEQLGEKIENELSKVTRAKLKPFGVHVIRCAVTDFARCRVIKRLTGS